MQILFALFVLLKAKSLIEVQQFVYNHCVMYNSIVLLNHFRDERELYCIDLKKLALIMMCLFEYMD